MSLKEALKEEKTRKMVRELYWEKLVEHTLSSDSDLTRKKRTKEEKQVLRDLRVSFALDLNYLQESLLRTTDILSKMFVNGDVDKSDVGFRHENDAGFRPWELIELWCRVYDKGSSMTEEKLREILGEMGKGAENTGPLFTGRNPCLEKEDNKIRVPSIAIRKLLKWTGQLPGHIEGFRKHECANCSHFDQCPFITGKDSDMDPKKVMRWHKANCPHKLRVKFVTIP
jgi:hypothetical protein